MPTIRGEDGPTDLLLGDVIISNEVLQYDRGQQLASRVFTVDTLQQSLRQPSKEIQSFARKMQGLRGRQPLIGSTSENLEKLLQTEGLEAYKYPGADIDKLYESTYHHGHHEPNACYICDNGNEVCNIALRSSCEQLACDTKSLVLRDRLGKQSQRPEHRIHFGEIASGDSVMKSARHRDDLASRQGVIAFEMEGAGV